MKKILLVIFIVISGLLLVSCDSEQSSTKKDVDKTIGIGDKLAEKQPTPTDINYSLERFNLIKRAYWVNGQRDKANSLQSEVPLPLGHIVLLNYGAIVGKFTVLGKVSSLNSFLTPDMIQKYINQGSIKEIELPDIDGSYGENDKGIFFFTVDGKYVEWTGDYLYSDLILNVDDPIIKIGD